MGISKRVLIRCKTGQKQGKKEKEKKTPILSLPLYIRDRDKTRLFPTLPAHSMSKHYQSLENIRMIGALPSGFITSLIESERPFKPPY